MHTKVLLSVLVLFSLLASCNMPAGQAPVVTQPPANEPAADANALATAVELTAVARVTEIAGSAVPAAAAFTATPTPTSPPVAAGPCGPTVTATVNANVRSGPGTAYDVVGSLMLGQTATIVGRNDAYTWWYIDFPGVAGNHAWIAGSVVTSACVPSVVQVVAAPPLPTEEVVEAPPTEEDEDGPIILEPMPGILLTIKRPDLVVTSMTVTPNPATQNQQITVQIQVKNQGNADAGNFSVQWWASWAVVACNKSVSSLAAGATKDLTCYYTYGGWNPAYAIKAVVDGGGLVNESNENNNSLEATLQVKPGP